MIKEYKYVKGFLTLKNLFYFKSIQIFHRFNSENFDTGELSDTLDTYVYHDKVFESLLKTSS